MPAFLDIGKGQCWQCPDGYERSLEPVDGPSACKRPVAAQRFAATKYGASGCQSGEFLDLTGNECWQCPTGYNRTLSAVTASDACATTISSQFVSATNHGAVPGCAEGQFTDLTVPGCWSCPSGSNRTVFAVNTPKACMRGEGVPQLFRGLCAAGQVLTGNQLGDPMACVAAMFKDGLPVEAGNPSSVEATGALCRLAGEFTSEHVARIFSPLGTIEDPVVRRGRMIAELGAIQEGLDSKALVERISKEPACMGFLSAAKDTVPTSVSEATAPPA